MNAGKKICAVFVACSLLVLAVGILFAMPRILENYRLSVQEWVAADAAGRINTYISAASAELAEASASTPPQIWEAAGRQPDLSQIKRKSYFFNEYFLFNNSGEIVRPSPANSAYLKLQPPLRTADNRPGSPFPAALTGPDGKKTVALIAPLLNARGQQIGWLAGSVNYNALRAEQDPIFPSGEKITLHLSDGESLVPLHGDAAAEVLNSNVVNRIPAERYIYTGNISLVSASAGFPGWWVVAVRHRAPAAAVFAADNQKITLPAVFISIILVTVCAFYVRSLIAPAEKIISKLGAITGDSRADADSLASGLDALTGNAGVLDNVPIGIMVVDSEGIIKIFNKEAGEITGRDPSSVTGKTVKEFFPSNYQNYIMESIITRREFLGLRSIIMVGDFFKELLMNVSPLYKGGTVTGAAATMQDVTPQRKLIEVKAAYTLSRDLALQKDLDSAVEVIAKSAAEMVDIEHIAVFIADRCENLIIRSSFGIPQKTVSQYNASPYKTTGPEVADLYRSHAPLLHGDVRNRQNLKPMLILPDVMSFYSFPIYRDEQLIGLINLYSGEKDKLSRERIYLIRSLSSQISAAITNFHEFQKMRAMASVDGLTGLFNKKYFLESIDAEIKNANFGNPLSLAILDIDYFKNVNDKHGHQTGDHVLVEVSSMLRQSLRESDIICRYGGEEFAVIMPGTPRGRALEVMERVRSTVEGALMAASGHETLSVTVSCGVACCPEDAGDAGQLIFHSDTALYTAKRTGRNKVVVYGPDQIMTV
ncbi:MAG: diguanylate cyclase [Bacillota bacterium]